MLFDMSASSNSRKIMQLNPEYPKDVTMKSTDGAAVFKTEIAKHGRPDEYTYQWYVNGAAVAEANHKEYERNISGDKGQYTVWCEVTNKAGTVRTRTATLTVNRLPVLDKNYPADASTTIGNACEFKATISEEGYPAEYTYQWYVNDSPVDGATAASYTRTAPAVGTETIYCVVTNKVGSVQSRTAKHTVTTEYVFKNGTFYNGGSWDWTHNSDTYAVCEVTDTWHLGVDGRGHFGATWTTKPVSTIGKNKLIFTVSATDTTGNNETGSGVGVVYVGITDSNNLGNKTMVAAVSFRPFDNFNSREYVVDLSSVNGSYYAKILIDREGVYDQDHVYVSAIRFE